MARTVFAFHFLNLFSIFSDQLKIKWICKISHNICVCLFVCHDISNDDLTMQQYGSQPDKRKFLW